MHTIPNIHAIHTIPTWHRKHSIPIIVTIQTIHTVISNKPYPTDLHTILTIHTITTIHAIHSIPTIHTKHTILSKHAIPDRPYTPYPTCHTTPPPHHRGGGEQYHTSTTAQRGERDSTTPPPHHRGEGDSSTTPQGGGARSQMGAVYGTIPWGGGGAAGPGAYIRVYIYNYIYIYIFNYIYTYMLLVEFINQNTCPRGTTVYFCFVGCHHCGIVRWAERVRLFGDIATPAIPVIAVT